jgi:formamidopyrimidine-DNA glycosylase
MPEIPDLTLYGEAILRFLKGDTLQRVRLKSPFLLRTVHPPVTSVQGKRLLAVSRIGKRLVLHMDDDLFLVFHLMIAGRLLWRRAGSPIPGKIGLAALDFGEGSLIVTEAGSKKRASLHLVQGSASLVQFDRGGMEVLESDLETFARALTRENHTLKRALTDPRLFAGIGNSYSDEILHDAKLSPLTLSTRLADGEIERLYESCRRVLERWILTLRNENGDGFPERVTAFRDGMSVHGRYGEPCPVCATIVQRIVYVDNECNYCPRCQTGGKILADRSLSRILRGDWPRSIAELEELQSSMTLGKGTRSSREKKR